MVTELNEASAQLRSVEHLANEGLAVSQKLPLRRIVWSSFFPPESFSKRSELPGGPQGDLTTPKTV